jgi:nucleoid-associated protein YgaU
MTSEPVSRWSAAMPVVDDDGRVVLTERPPFSFRERADSRSHQVLAGDTLAALAGSYYAPWPRACGYWWAIAEFQVEPIIDPTRPLEPGRVLTVPSLAALEEFLGGAT